MFRLANASRATESLFRSLPALGSQGSFFPQLRRSEGSCTPSGADEQAKEARLKYWKDVKEFGENTNLHSPGHDLVATKVVKEECRKLAGFVAEQLNEPATNAREMAQPEASQANRTTDELEATKLKVAQLEGKVAKLEEELKSAKIERDENKSKVAKLEEELKSAKIERDENKRKVAQLEGKVAKLEEELEAAKLKVAQLEDKVAQLDVYMSKLMAVEAERQAIILCSDLLGEFHAILFEQVKTLEQDPMKAKLNNKNVTMNSFFKSLNRTLTRYKLKMGQGFDEYNAAHLDGLIEFDKSGNFKRVMDFYESHGLSRSDFFFASTVRQLRNNISHTELKCTDGALLTDKVIEKMEKIKKYPTTDFGNRSIQLAERVFQRVQHLKKTR